MTTSIFQASLEKIYGKLTICPSEHNVDDMAYFFQSVLSMTSMVPGIGYST